MILYPATSLPQFSRSVVSLDGLLLGVEMDGVAWVFDSLSGWTLGGGVSNAFAERPGAHGEFDGPAYRRSRVLNISGVCIADTPLLAEQAAEALAAVMADGRLGSFTVDSPLRTLSASVRLSDTPQAEWLSDTAFRWALQFTAPDPRKYDLPSIATTGLPSGALAGLRFPAYFPLGFDVVGETATRTNQATNPSVNVNTLYWSAGFQTGATGTGTRLTDATGVPFSTYFRFAVSSVTTGAIASTGIVVGTPAADSIPVVGGRTYTLSAYARSSHAGRTVSFVVTFHDAAGTQVGISGGPTATLTSAWGRVSHTGITAPATATRAYVRLYANGGTAWVAGDTMDMGGFLVDESATLRPYFDGGTASADGHGAWTGTAGASTSTWYTYTRADVSAGGRVALSNSGTAPAEPVFTVEGSFPSGFQVTHVETGKRLRYEAPAVGEFVLDAREGRVSTDGQDRSGYLTVREWPSVAPGASATFAISAIGDPALASGSLTVTFSPAFF